MLSCIHMDNGYGSVNADVIVCGGGLAGLCVARQLRREVPRTRVILIERTPSPLPEAAHKVGESSVELASHYFGHTLGLESYLRERQLIKNGLRFFPGGGATHPLAERTEIGPPALPVVPSYQIDRGRFENDLRAMCEADGVEMRLGASVRELTLGKGGEPHHVELADGTVLRARFLIDASGRRQLIQRKLGLRRDNGHDANAAWFRVRGRLEPRHLVPAEDVDWHRRDPDDIRWLSTNHFMGPGYWVWFIPLASGYTSVGIAAHASHHPFERLNTLERALAWIARHEPFLAPVLEHYEVADFRCYKSYSYGSARVFSADGWACVGEAGLFVDPFYSPGSDFIALANTYAVELVRAQLDGEELGPRADFYDAFYRRTALIATETYRLAAEVYGRPHVLAAKVYWDNFSYWSFLCQYFFQDLIRLSPEEQGAVWEVGDRFALLNVRAQQLFHEWAHRAEDEPERRAVIMPPIPSILANLHLDLKKRMSPDEALAYMNEKADRATELLAEFVLRAIAAVGVEAGEDLLKAVGAHEWDLSSLGARLEAERGEPRKRRQRLSRLARDVERTLGRIVLHSTLASIEDTAPLLTKAH